MYSLLGFFIVILIVGLIWEYSLQAQKEHKLKKGSGNQSTLHSISLVINLNRFIPLISGTSGDPGILLKLMNSRFQLRFISFTSVGWPILVRITATARGTIMNDFPVRPLLCTQDSGIAGGRGGANVASRHSVCLLSYRSPPMTSKCVNHNVASWAEF